MRTFGWVLYLAGFAACTGDSDDKTEPVDADNDGYPAAEDCDDSRSDVNPGADEVCDAIDNDCDTEIDEEAVDALSFYADSDGDTYGDLTVSVTACVAPEGYVADSLDCDDGSAAVYPGAPEVCDAQDTDENCDGLAENEASDNDPATQTLYYADADQDTFGDEQDPGTLYCNDPSTASVWMSPDHTDCDDADSTVYPGAEEVLDFVDSDCDGGGEHISLAQADGKLTGENSDDRASYSVGSAGDVNADGYSDVLVGVHHSGSSVTGAVYLLLGSASGLPEGSLSVADVKLTGEGLGARAGHSVDSAGDVNNDGYSDVIIGAYGDDEGGLRSGAAYIVLGSSSGPSDASLSTADAKLVGEQVAGNAAWSVSTAGDVDNDGYSDVLIGAPFEDDEEYSIGAVYLVMGSASGVSDMSLSAAEGKLTGEVEGSVAGYSVDSAGDVNGDGYSDVLIGAHGATTSGAAYIVLGSASGVGHRSLSTADAKLTGENPEDLAGFSVSSAGDVNGDGYADVLIGAYGVDEGGVAAGAAYLVHGSNSGVGTMNLADADAKFTGEGASDFAGTTVSSAGDFNDDTYSDILIGAYGAETNTGAAYLVLGSESALGDMSLADADAKLTGEAIFDQASYGLGSAGDVNGDGVSDLLVGAPSAQDSNEGAVYLLYGL